MKRLQITPIAKGKIDFLQLYRIDPAYYPALLETVLKDNQQPSTHPSGTNPGCFDILFCNPQQTLRLSSPSDRTDFLQQFNQSWLEQSQPELKPHQDVTVKTDYPFKGGWFLYLSYELAQQVEPVLELPNSRSSLPTAYACRFKSALIYDHQCDETVLISESDLAEQDFQALSAKVFADIQQIDELPELRALPLAEIEQDEPQTYIDSVQRVKQYIVDGDVFQVNLSRQWNINISEQNHHPLAAALYAGLRKSNPAPFAGLVHIDGASIISSSPERLLKVSQKVVESRPIAGTRPRSENDDEDRNYRQQLHRHPKEKAEHIMLIDLIRNDLGRVCQPGTIEANELMVNESYAHVHHIVSNIRGVLRENILPGDVIRALFPGGTITGCPKVRCMEIIAEQEQVARDAYTGSLGYVNRDGSMDLNILIRTMILQPSESAQTLSFRAGAGLVADSDPDHELNETRAKALGMLKVFQ